MMYCKSVYRTLMMVILLATLSFSPLIAMAATLELTAQMKVSFNKTTAAADGKTAAKLTNMYNEFNTLQASDRSWETKIKDLHYRNEEAATILRKQIREIDAAKIDKLELEVKQIKERYEPLFSSYTSVNKQISLAKHLKNKTLNTVLRTQADVMKIAVSIAREEIRGKQALLKSAKDAAASKIKAARAMLSAIDPIKVQIKAAKSAASLPRKSLSSTFTNFKYAIKKSEINSTSYSLSTLIQLSRQVVDQQQKRYNLESKISNIITNTRNKFV